MKAIFRAHSRTLVLVFMSLLLVVFLIDRPVQELFRMATSENFRIGEAFGRTVTSSDYSEAAADATIIREFFFLAEKQLDNAEFYLMSTEARKAGVRVGEEQVRDLLARVPSAAERIDQLRSAHGRSVPQIYNALASFLAVQEYANLQASAIVPSTVRVRQDYLNAEQSASAEFSVLQAVAFLPHVPDATDEEIAKAFEEGKNRTTQHEDDKLVFGYLEPDRVKIEYITIDPKSLESIVTVSLKDAKLYYEQNKLKYQKDVADPGPAPEGVPQTHKVQQTFEEVEQQVRNEKRAEKAVAEALKLAETMQREAAKAWDAMPVDRDGFHDAPPAEKTPTFAALAEKFGAQAGIKLVVTTSDWVDGGHFNEQPGIGFASVSGGGGDSAQSLAFRVKGIYKRKEGEKKATQLNLNEPSPVLVRSAPSPQGPGLPTAAFLMRVVDAKASGAPESLEPIKAKVAADVKFAKAYAMAKTWADKIEIRAKEVGLKGAIDEMGDLKKLLEPAASTQPDALAPSRENIEALGPFTPPTDFKRSPRGLVPHIGYMPKVHSAVFDALAKRTTTSPAHLIVRVNSNEFNRFASGDQPSTTSKFVLAEAQELKPVYQGDFDKAREQSLVRVARGIRGIFENAWEDADERHIRTQYKPATR